MTLEERVSDRGWAIVVPSWLKTLLSLRHSIAFQGFDSLGLPDLRLVPV